MRSESNRPNSLRLRKRLRRILVRGRLDLILRSVRDGLVSRDSRVRRALPPLIFETQALLLYGDENGVPQSILVPCDGGRSFIPSPVVLSNHLEVPCAHVR